MKNKNELKKTTDHKVKIIGNQTDYLQNIQLQSYDDGNCNFCKFFLNIERDSDILISSGRLFHCLPA